VLVKAAIAIGIALVALGAARAEAGPKVEVEAAASIAGGDEVVSSSFRGFLGVGQALGRGRGWHALGALGLHVGTGVIYASDPRALDESVELQFSTVGPELRAGVVYVDGGYVDTRFYVAAAPLQVGVDDRLDIMPVAGVHGGRGLRLAIGVTYADQWGKAFHGNEAAWLILFLPQSFEVIWERSGGKERTGVSFGWGF
jgi:hypothetical protein